MISGTSTRVFHHRLFADDAPSNILDPMVLKILCDRFPAGVDTPDLRAARALLGGPSS